MQEAAHCRKPLGGNRPQTWCLGCRLSPISAPHCHRTLPQFPYLYKPLMGMNKCLLSAGDLPSQAHGIIILPTDGEAGAWRKEVNVRSREGAAPTPFPEQLLLASTCPAGPTQPGLFTPMALAPCFPVAPAALGRTAHTSCTVLEQRKGSLCPSVHSGAGWLPSPRPHPCPCPFYGPGSEESEPQLRGLENRAEPDPFPLLGSEVFRCPLIHPIFTLKCRNIFFSLERFPSRPEAPRKSVEHSVAL